MRYIIYVENEVLCQPRHVGELRLCDRFNTGELVALEELSNIPTLIFDYLPVLNTAFIHRGNAYQVDLKALRS